MSTPYQSVAVAVTPMPILASAPPPQDWRFLRMLAVLVFITALGTALGVLDGCGEARSADRAIARGAVLTVVEAVKIADSRCAEVSIARRDVELARRCATAYDDARLALIVTASSIDTWDRASSRDNVACAAHHAAQDLQMIASELDRLDEPVPPVVRDAISGALSLGGCFDGS
jgi:hypothetical protein